MSNCVLWAGAMYPSGYGKKRYGGRVGMAHRWVWEQANGPIPPGQVVRHRCDNPGCVNVAHLELGTQADNMRDAVERGRHFSMHRGKTHCVNNHEFTEENTRHYGGRRVCRACQRDASRKMRRNQAHV